jgi:hypothetical protein
MHKAAASGNALLVACLARSGCSVSMLSRDGCTPLALSVRRGDVECVKACAWAADAKEAAFVIDSSSGRSLLHDVAALPPPMEWEEMMDAICDFCSDLCVFVGKRATATSSSSSSYSVAAATPSNDRPCTDVEVILGICVTSIDCGVHAHVDVVSRDIDFLSSSWRRLLRSSAAVVAVASPLINVMLNADSLVALPLLLFLQNLSDVDTGLTPYALLNQSGTGSRGRQFERTAARYVQRCRASIEVVAEGRYTIMGTSSVAAAAYGMGKVERSASQVKVAVPDTIATMTSSSSLDANDMHSSQAVIEASAESREQTAIVAEPALASAAAAESALASAAAAESALASAAAAESALASAAAAAESALASAAAEASSPLSDAATLQNIAEAAATACDGRDGPAMAPLLVAADVAIDGGVENFAAVTVGLEDAAAQSGDDGGGDVGGGPSSLSSSPSTAAAEAAAELEAAPAEGGTIPSPISLSILSSSFSALSAQSPPLSAASAADQAQVLPAALNSDQQKPPFLFTAVQNSAMAETLLPPPPHLLPPKFKKRGGGWSTGGKAHGSRRGVSNDAEEEHSSPNPNNIAPLFGLTMQPVPMVQGDGSIDKVVAADDGKAAVAAAVADAGMQQGGAMEGTGEGPDLKINVKQLSMEMMQKRDLVISGDV